MMEQQRKQNLDIIDIGFDWRGSLFGIASSPSTSRKEH